MNPYHNYVAEHARLLREGKLLPLGGFPPAHRPPIPDKAPRALFFAPHPDDECICGGLPLRLLREARMQVINVAVTQGSKPERQAERLAELEGACSFLGFGLATTGEHGLDGVDLKARESNPDNWAHNVRVIVGILDTFQPRVVFIPHENDWHPTHIGTHLLVLEALQKRTVRSECFVVESEFWGQMQSPNLMVEISTEDLADLVAGTTFHVGEVKRNPYHLLMPAWMMDNVRRGSELVGGQGATAADFIFATLYRVRKWGQGQLTKCWEGGRKISKVEDIGALFQ